MEVVLGELASKSARQAERLRKKAWKRCGEEHPDKELLDPSPVPLIIIGTKYDLFQVRI